MGNEQARVLIVDDEAGMRHTLEAGLMQRGFDIDDVEEGLPALELIENAYARGRPYACVISDIMLPDINGIKLLEIIKSRYQKLPVIIISAYGNDITPEEVTSKLGDGYLPKPFLIDELTQVMDRVQPKISALPAEPAPEVQRQSKSAYCLVRIKENGDFMNVYRKLNFMDNVLYCDAVRDHYDIALLLNGDSYRELEKVAKTKIKAIPDVDEVDYVPVIKPKLDASIEEFMCDYEKQCGEERKQLLPRRDGKPISAYVLIEVDKSRCSAVFPKLYFLDAVVSCDMVRGSFDIVLLMQSTSFRELERILTEEIRPLDGILRTRMLKNTSLLKM
jgi:CheY-like chemotaxis protein